MKKIGLLISVLQLASLYCQEQKYIPWKNITPGQLRYSSLNVADKIMAAIKKNAATWQPIRWQLAYDNGKSIMPLREALPVIKGPHDRLVLVDGHHETLASIALGATTIPVYIKKDLSNVAVNEFWQQAEKEGFIYPYTIGGNYKLPRSFKDLEDDPYRYFAAIAARKCAAEGQPNDKSIGWEYPLWIKIGKDIPFIEFRISDTLQKYAKEYGFEYTNQMGNAIPQELVEKARKILKDHPIEGLKLVPEKKHFTEIPELCGKVKVLPVLK